MVKSDEEAIAKFNEYVNMTADELEHWLKDPDSESAGWPKNADEEGGETVGHESGRKIVEILRENPDKDPSAYPSSALPHIHKVVAYCARHIAQEDKLKESKTEEELEKTKSTKSLKNWGHDPIKTLHPSKSNGSAETKDEGKGKGKGKAAKEDDEDEKEDEKTDNEEDDSDDEDAGQVGGKRKRPVRKSAEKASKADPSSIPPLEDYDSAEDDDYESDEEGSDDGAAEEEGSGDEGEGEDGSESGSDEDDDEEDEAEEEDGETEGPPAKKTK